MNTRERDDTLTLEILEAIEESSDVTQRRIARRLGVALGLANSYLKRCARKGLIKVQQAPANRYLYYLTPQGFAEKSRLTAEYLRVSLSFYRRASDSLERLFADCRKCDQTRLVLCGVSDLAEIATLRAVDFGLVVVAVYDTDAEVDSWARRPVWRNLPPADLWDVCAVTDHNDPLERYLLLVAQVGAERVRVPDVLGVNTESSTTT